MNYLYPDYGLWYSRFILMGGSFFLYIYNYQVLNYNAHWRALNKLVLVFLFYYSARTIYHYKKDVLRANLFDEYVQLRSDELVNEREHLLKSEGIPRFKSRGEEMGLVQLGFAGYFTESQETVLFQRARGLQGL